MRKILQNKDIIYNKNMLKYEIKIERILTLLYYFLVVTLIAAGFYLRIRLYLASYPFWIDEIYLGASFTDRGIKEMFEPLDFIQKVPPFFCILCLLVTRIAGFSELSLRFIPLVAGLVSVLGFYYLLTLIYRNKLVILMGLTLFSINMSLIYYSQEFHNYSFDLMICIFLMIIYLKRSLKDMDYKQTILYTIITVIMLLFSYIVAFVVPAMIIAKSIEERHINWKALWILAAVIGVSIYYYFFYKDLIAFLNSMYEITLGYLKLNIISLKKILNENLYFYIFRPMQYLYPYLYCLFFCGVIFLFKENRKAAFLFSFILLTALVVSYLEIFPLLNRTIIYLVPIFILIIIKNVDYLSSDKIYFKLLNFIKSMFFIVLILSLHNYDTLIHHLSNYDLITFRCPMEYRTQKQDISKYFYQNYINGEPILYTADVFNFLKYYKKILASDKELNFILNNNAHSEEGVYSNINSFLLQNKNTDTGYWLMGAHTPLSGSFNYDSDFIKDKLQKGNIPFELHKNEYLYAFHVLPNNK